MAVTQPEIERLYRAHAPGLRRIVRFGVHAPDATIEDACQAAWSQLLDHRDRVHLDAAVTWLARTARREAVRLTEVDGRTLSLDQLLERRAEVRALGVLSAPECFEQRERLRALAVLPVRQQRLLWLKGLGLSYAEMARHEGCTRRTVERQLFRARRAPVSVQAAEPA